MRSSGALRAFLALVVVGLAGCAAGGLMPPTPGDMSPPTPGPAPLVHRPAATACTSERPAYQCLASGGMWPCAKDADCNAGRNGRCVGNGHDGCSCSYDTCVVDSDCKTGELCDCRSPWHYGDKGPARCLPANCRTDADCGTDGYCSPSMDFGCGAYLGVTGWFCHTPADSCTNDSDCKNLDGGWGTPFCGYRPEVGRWACSTSMCAG